MDKKENDARETESLLLETQINTIETNCIKSKMDNTQQNCKCSLWDERDKTINYMISECSKLEQKK